MVETGGLENRCTGNRTGGSNPSPSARFEGHSAWLWGTSGRRRIRRDITTKPSCGGTDATYCVKANEAGVPSRMGKCHT